MTGARLALRDSSKGPGGDPSGGIIGCDCEWNAAADMGIVAGEGCMFEGLRGKLLRWWPGDDEDGRLVEGALATPGAGLPDVDPNDMLPTGSWTGELRRGIISSISMLTPSPGALELPAARSSVGGSRILARSASSSSRIGEYCECPVAGGRTGVLEGASCCESDGVG